MPPLFPRLSHGWNKRWTLDVSREHSQCHPLGRYLRCVHRWFEFLGLQFNNIRNFTIKIPFLDFSLCIVSEPNALRRTQNKPSQWVEYGYKWVSYPILDAGFYFFFNRRPGIKIWKLWVPTEGWEEQAQITESRNKKRIVLKGHLISSWCFSWLVANGIC